MITATNSWLCHVVIRPSLKIIRCSCSQRILAGNLGPTWPSGSRPLCMRQSCMHGPMPSGTPRASRRLRAVLRPVSLVGLRLHWPIQHQGLGKLHWWPLSIVRRRRQSDLHRWRSRNGGRMTSASIVMIFSNGHKTVCKQLFVIEVMSEEEGDMPAVTEEPTISLHALTGI
jgi:hypothetical protein